MPRTVLAPDTADNAPNTVTERSPVWLARLLKTGPALSTPFERAP